MSRADIDDNHGGEAPPFHAPQVLHRARGHEVGDRRFSRLSSFHQLTREVLLAASLNLYGMNATYAPPDVQSTIATYASNSQPWASNDYADSYELRGSES